MSLRDPLPVVPVPLLAPDEDAPLDLSLALATVYDEARYNLSIDYRKQADPPLVGDDAVWAALIGADGRLTDFP